MASDAAISSSATSPWSELMPELLGRVIAELLLFPADLARFRVVCRAWRSAARQHVRQLPWMVLPDASFCTIGGGDLVHCIPGLPENVTCLGSAADGWLALDCTDDEYRRTPYRDKFVDNNTFPRPRADAMHRHTYMLHNPFSGETLPLSGLDDLVGHVAETFEIRKVLMRSSSPHDVVAVATNNRGCNIILCRPGIEGWLVVPDVRVCDIAFHGGMLYGITPEEALVAFDLSDEDEDGMPIVTKIKRVIMQPIAHGEQDPYSSMYDDDDDDGNGSDNDHSDDEQSSDEEQESDDERSDHNEEDSSFNSVDSDDNNDDDDDLPSINDDEEADEEDEESSDDEASDQEVEYSLNDDGGVPDGEELGTDEPKDYTCIRRHLVESCEGQYLLMVRHHTQAPPHSRGYTRKVEVFKADIEGGKWVPVTTDALAQGEALFLSRPYCKCTRVYGDIEEGFIYFMDMDDVFDTRSWTRRPLALPPRWRREDEKLLTWFFPPELVL